MEVAAPPQGRARLEPRRLPTTTNMKYAPPVFLSRSARFEPSPRLQRRRRAHPDHRVAAVAGGARGGGVEPHRAGIARHRTVARPRHLRGEGGCTEARSRPLARLGYDRTAAGAAETALEGERFSRGVSRWNAPLGTLLSVSHETPRVGWLSRCLRSRPIRHSLSQSSSLCSSVSLYLMLGILLCLPSLAAWSPPLP